MWDRIKTFCVIMVISLITVNLSNALESKFLFNYLSSNLISLLLTLLAINTATLGLIASKLQDIYVTNLDVNFENTIKEMKFSLIEQIALVIISILTLIVDESAVISFNNKEQISNVILVSVLIYSIDILWDTGNGVFVIIDELQEMKRKTGT